MKNRRSRQKKPQIIEQGVIRKKGRNLIKAALVYPNTYEAGMSSLGFQTLYSLINEIEHVSCERVFLSDKKASKNEEALSIESRLSLKQFDFIFFSISFENDFIHILQLLDDAGIPLQSQDRNPHHPLMIAGGVACFLNPEPIAPFMDAFLLGEAECLIKKFFLAFEAQPDRSTLLRTLEETVTGAYVPTCHTNDDSFQIQVQYLKSLKQVSTYTSILTTQTTFKNTMLIEILKGCPHGCRFCSSGFLYRPPRPYTKDTLFSIMDNTVGKTDKIGLVSSAIADHPRISEICQYGKALGFKLSFSSLRADKLDENLSQTIARAGVKTATIAPEAGSSRMRAVINKKISEEQILEAVQKLVGEGIINIKLYFMIGLPFEQDGDIHAIVDLTRKIKAQFLQSSRPKKKIGTLTLSINPFIPKPFTPFQWAAMCPEDVLTRRVNIIKQGLKNIPNLRLNIESLRQAKIHALLSSGDRKTAEILTEAYKTGWTKALKKYKDYCESIIYREKPLTSPLSWDFLNNGIKKSFLAEEYKRAEKEMTSPSCPMKDCDECRICRA
jgi:radical SAM superfamily enzyme YgiQ (UPF0313 family)